MLNIDRFREHLTILKHRYIGQKGKLPLAYLGKYLPKSPVVIEAGAHNGCDTLEMARMWPYGHVHAFEPLPTLLAEVRRRTAADQNVSCYQLALGEAVGTAEFFVSSGSDESDGSSSLLRPSGHLTEYPDIAFSEVIHVNVTTLDAWAAETGVDRADFLWLDLQGGELAALRGAGKLLPTVRMIYSEVSLKPLYENGPLYPEYRAWLEAQGFQVLREDLPPSYSAGNVLFIRV
jgi:FkbM family methyltransferase